ncbi:MAG: hypothetical protein ACOYOT_06595 [Bacteroidales bacterium]
MRNLNIIFTLIILINLFSGCSKDNEPQNNMIDSYFYGYMDYENYATSPNAINVKLIYENGKVIKRVGDMLISPYFPTITTDSIYDEITYINNEIHIVKKSNFWIMNPNERIIYLDNQQRMLKMIDYQTNTGFDKTIYEYDSKGLLLKSTTILDLRKDTIFTHYYFNSSSNLDSIVTYSIENPLYKRVIVLSDYDNHINPMKHLFLFKETFNRSLSKNNYRQKEIKEITDNQLFIHNIFKNSFPYDSNGNPIFSK